MLDRTKDIASQAASAEGRTEAAPAAKTGSFGATLRRYWQSFVGQGSSSLTRRIVLLNVAGLFALVVGILFLSQSRAFFIEARVRSLLVQAEIIAGAIAASATVETDSLTIDPERMLELQLGETYGPSEESLAALEFPINPERVAPVLRRLISPTNTRARIYDRDGVLLLDSRNLYGRGDVLRFDLPSPNAERPGFFERQFNSIRKWLAKGELPMYVRSSVLKTAKVIRKSPPRWRARRPAWSASIRAARSSSRSRHRCNASARCAARCCFRRKAPTSTRRSKRSGLRSSKCF